MKPMKKPPGIDSSSRDIPGDWQVDRFADLVSQGCTENHDSLGKAMLSIWRLAQKGWFIFTLRLDGKRAADVFVKPDFSEVRIKIEKDSPHATHP